jgi:hypothetical protein
MLGRFLKFLLLIAILCSALSGCAYMTKSGRQQMAMERYIRKCSGKRVRMVKVKAPKIPRTPEPSDYRVSTGVSESPQSVSSNE